MCYIFSCNFLLTFCLRYVIIVVTVFLEGGLLVADKKTEIMRVTPAEKALIEVVRQKGSEVVILALGKILEGGLEIGIKKTDL